MPDFPKEPTQEEILTRNDLKDADEETLLRYVSENSSSIGYWLPSVTAQEQQRIASEYLRKMSARDSSAQEYWKTSIEQLTEKRLIDSRRIVDTVLRKLGQNGSAESIPHLLSIADQAERPWEAWKSLASVQEILPRVDPTKLHHQFLRGIGVDLLAPLLRDLDDTTASRWAWTLWEHHQKWLTVSFRSRVPLRTRLWMARSFATLHRDVAGEVFLEGLKSNDAALRTAAEMFIRSGLGGSIPHGSSPVELLRRYSEQSWTPNQPIWEILPTPLGQPLVRKHEGGGSSRTDLIWLSRDAAIMRDERDVWPMVCAALPNGLFYSRVGDSWPPSFALTTDQGDITARFPKLSEIHPLIASHGGLWSLSGQNHATEFFPDGTVDWQCPPSGSIAGGYRAVAPIGSGRVVILGYTFLQCRDRRGDVIWECSLDGLDDPRSIFPISDRQFIVSCTNSVGWFTPAGKYTPVLEGVKSALWVRYHPTSEWIIFDGGNWEAILFDPSTKSITGRFDLDDGGERAQSRFSSDQKFHPE